MTDLHTGFVNSLGFLVECPGVVEHQPDVFAELIGSGVLIFIEFLEHGGEVHRIFDHIEIAGRDCFGHGLTKPDAFLVVEQTLEDGRHFVADVVGRERRRMLHEGFTVGIDGRRSIGFRRFGFDPFALDQLHRGGRDIVTVDGRLRAGDGLLLLDQGRLRVVIGRDLFGLHVTCLGVIAVGICMNGIVAVNGHSVQAVGGDAMGVERVRVRVMVVHGLRFDLSGAGHERRWNIGLGSDTIGWALLASRLVDRAERRGKDLLLFRHLLLFVVLLDLVDAFSEPMEVVLVTHGGVEGLGFGLLSVAGHGG